MSYTAEAPPERGIFFRLQVYERVGISLVEVFARVGKSVIMFCKKAQKGKQMSQFYGFLKKSKTRSGLVIDSY